MSKDLILSYLCKRILDQGNPVPKCKYLFEEFFVEYHLDGMVIIGRSGFKIRLYHKHLSTPSTRYPEVLRRLEVSQFFSFSDLLHTFQSIGFACVSGGWPSLQLSKYDGRSRNFRKYEVTAKDHGLGIGNPAFQLWEEVSYDVAYNEVQEGIQGILTKSKSLLISTEIKNRSENYLNTG